MISLYVFYSVLSIKTNKDIWKMIIKLKVYSYPIGYVAISWWSFYEDAIWIVI